MNKHTPGPWEAIPSAQLRENGMVHVTRDNGSVVASAWEDADARLTAAAPDLLAALQLMIVAYEHEASPENPALLQARAAFAKATS